MIASDARAQTQLARVELAVRQKRRRTVWQRWSTRLGLALVEALATRWGVDRTQPAPGKCVWLELSTAAAVPYPATA